MKEKFLLFSIFYLLFSSISFADNQVNVADLVSENKVADYEQAHKVQSCDSEHLKKKAHFYSQQLKRQSQDTDRQLGWMDGCIKDYKEGLPIYDTSCVLALKESEEEQRERIGDAIHNGASLLAPAVLLFKSLGGL